MATDKVFEITAQKSIRQINGELVQVLTYNNSFPGPLLEVNEGDHVKVIFKNELSTPSNLHLHGIFMDPEEDKPHHFVQPGETVTYSFQAQEGSAGMYWYHPHAHGTVTRQLFEGLAGPIIIRGKQDHTEPLASVTEKILVLHDITVVQGQVGAHAAMEWGKGKEGCVVLVNGDKVPNFNVSTGLLRLRIVNASTARFYLLQIPGKKLNIIGHDGSYIEKPMDKDEILLVPGERVDIIIEANEAGQLNLINRPYSRTPAGPSVDTLPEGSLLASFQIMGEYKKTKLPSDLISIPTIANLEAPTDKTIRFGVNMEPLQWLINGKAFDHIRTDLVSKSGTTEIWEIVNPTAMDHPFHLHTFPFQVLSQNNVPEAYQAWKDVVNIKAGHSVKIAIPFTDFKGSVMLHCHILEHEDLGMMANLLVE